MAVPEKTEIQGILRLHGYTLSRLAGELGITKSYLSKILSGKRNSEKYEKAIQERIRAIEKTPLYTGKMARKTYRNLRVRGFFDIVIKNNILTILKEKGITMTQMADAINEPLSSVCQVVCYKRHTERIANKIVDYLERDYYELFLRTSNDIQDIMQGKLVPLKTPSEITAYREMLKRPFLIQR